MSPRTIRRRLMAIAAIAAVSLGGLNAASASTRARAEPNTPGNPVRESVSELYTAVTPCRIVDTRLVGGPLVSVRHFDTVGNPAGQGGASNCGIPANATSLAVNITAISEGDGPGYLRGWGFLGGPVNATLLNYSGDINMSNMVNLQMCKGISCIHSFDLRSYGTPANAVVDVIGYYQRPLFANIGIAGALGDASGAVTAARPSTGLYTINFDRDVDSCTTTVTSTDATNAHAFAVAPYPGQAYIIQVHVRTLAGALTNAPFAVHLRC